MSATLTRPAWTTEFEIDTIDKLIAQHAPHFPTTRLQEPRQLTTAEEFENFYRFRIGGAAHDLYIVQVCSKVIDQIPDPELQLFLSASNTLYLNIYLELRIIRYEKYNHAINSLVKWN
jgi:hypothetical protein